jgi:HSP20 family protein
MEKQATEIVKTEPEAAKPAPVFVEFEKMFDRFAELSKETAERAFDFFQRRGRAFGDQLDDWFKAESEILRPIPVEITEDEQAVMVRAEVPGFKPDEIEVSVKDNILFMSGETASEKKKEDEKIFYSEWKSNRFCRQLELPAEIEADGVNAELKAGVLTMTLKKKAAEEASKIRVKAA